MIRRWLRRRALRRLGRVSTIAPMPMGTLLARCVYAQFAANENYRRWRAF